MSVRISVESLIRDTGQTKAELDKCCYRISMEAPAKDYYIVCSYHEGFDDGFQAGKREK
jgi:hypothetical protein